jgi:small multidrug resistance family-3 protein
VLCLASEQRSVASPWHACSKYWIYAAYGGVYIATAILWQWVVEHQRPDRWDVLGAGVCLTGMAIIVLGPRAS